MESMSPMKQGTEERKDLRDVVDEKHERGAEERRKDRKTIVVSFIAGALLYLIITRLYRFLAGMG